MDNDRDLSRNEVWLAKLTRAVKDNLANENFGVAELSDALAISRYQLHRKIKALRGQSVSQFVREIRLKEAMTMLQVDVATTAEIAYRVGFSSPSYFNKCFHDFYGYPPGEARRRSAQIPISHSGIGKGKGTAAHGSSSETAVRKPIKGFMLIVTLLAVFSIGAPSLISPQAPRELSIAVLPLYNLTGSPDNRYFVDGIHDALIGELGKVSALRVISRTSTLRYSNSNKLLQSIADELDVDLIIEGSVAGTSDSLRLQLQLIEVFPQERHLWAKEYHEDVRKVLEVHSSVVHDIAHEIKVSLTPEEQMRLQKTRLVNPESYRAYLRGMYYINQATRTQVEKGIEHLLKAVDADPADPLPWAGLAIGYSTLGHGPSVIPDASVRARAAASKAIALDPTLAEAHLALGMIALYSDWDWNATEKAFTQALKFNPNLAQAHTHYAWFKMLFGDTEAVLFHGKKATELDPFSALYSGYLASEYWWLGRNDLALQEAGNALKIAPENGFALYVQGGLFASQSMTEDAIKIHQKAVDINPQWKWTLGRSYVGANRSTDAWKIVDELTDSPSPMDAWGLAEIYAAMGDNDSAFHWLEESYRMHFSWVPWIAWNPNYKSLQGDPRFNDLLNQLNLPSSASNITHR